MRTDEWEPIDHRHSHSRVSDLPRGRSEAAEEFGVPLRPEGLSGWAMGLYWFPAYFIILGVVALVALAVAPPHPIDPDVLGAALVYIAFAVAFLAYMALLALEALASRRKRKAEGRQYLERLKLTWKESAPRRGP